MDLKRMGLFIADFKNVILGAGSTTTRNTPLVHLTWPRGTQLSIPNWNRPVKQEK